MSTLTAFDYIPERSAGTPGLWNRVFSILSDNIRAANDNTASIGTTVTIASGNTLSILTNIDVARHVKADLLSVGSTPTSTVTNAHVIIAAHSGGSDYIQFHDSSAARSNYLLGSHAGGTADGLNIYDLSGNTLIVSFSKQSIRFFQNVVGPVFDVGGALASTYNAATFGTGADSRESRIQAAIDQASVDAVSRVYIPANMYPYSASSVSFIHAVQMVREGGDWSNYDVIAYGANSRGTGNATAAVQAAITAAGNDPVGFGQKVVLPQGAYVITSTLTMGADRVTLEGAGKMSSILFFIPAVDSSCVRVIKSGGTALIARNVIRGVGFQSAATNTQVKTAIDLWSVTEAVVEDIDIVPGTWVNGSIGIRTKGREATLLHNLGLFCDRPLVISKSSYDWIDCDHFNISDFYGLCTIGSAGTVVEIESGVVVTNTSWNGYQAWVGGQSGLGWDDSASTNVSYNVAFNNVRYEQGTNANGWNIYVNRSAVSLQNIEFNNCYFGLPARGVHLRRVAGSVLFNNCVYDSSTNTAADFDASVRQLLFHGCFWQAGSTASTTNLTERWRLNKEQNASPLPDTGFLSDSVFPTTGFLVGDGNTSIPSMSFINDSALGWCRSNTNTIAQSTGTLDLGRVYTSLATSRLTAGTAINPAIAFASETSLGLYRSAASRIAMSYGQLAVADGGTAQPGLTFVSNQSVGLWYVPAASGIYVGISSGGNDAVYIGGTGGVVRLAQAGSAIQPSLTFNSEASLGWYRSAASTMALSYGTLRVGELYVTGSGISIGNVTAGGTLIPAISSTSSLIAAFVVQGSSSSFTRVVWAAAQPGDHIMVTPGPTATVSSISSGLVAHSHCTQAGQIEFRLSNVSTLAQNQSTRTWYFTRISPF